MSRKFEVYKCPAEQEKVTQLKLVMKEKRNGQSIPVVIAVDENGAERSVICGFENGKLCRYLFVRSDLGFELEGMGRVKIHDNA